MTNLKKYRMRKGKHYSGFRLRPFLSKSVAKYEVVFTKSCIYKFDNENQYDVNKLFGLAFMYHHIDSARFGWRADGDKIEISAYCYKDGNRCIKEMCVIDTEKPYSFELRDSGKYYEFEIRDESTEFFSYARISKPVTVKFGYELFPYFGGDEVAPHDIEILMRKIQ